jgi:hypothetical protein
MQRHGPSCLTGPLSRRNGKFLSSSPAPSAEVDMREPARKPLTEGERQARIQRIRREIAAGAYDTPEKFALALEKLLRRLEAE